MREPENNYQTARKDAIKVAAALGTVAAARWAYGKYKRAGGDLDRDTEGCILLIGFLVMLPVLLPFYLYYRRKCVSISQSNIQGLEAKKEQLWVSMGEVQRRISEMSLGHGDTVAAKVAVRSIEEDVGKLDQKIQRSAEMWATRLYQDVKRLESDRKWVLNHLGNYSRAEVETRLQSNSIKLEPLKARLKEIEERYGVEADENFHDAFIANFRGRLMTCAVLGFILALWWLFAVYW